jgi:hypothetical protein
MRRRTKQRSSDWGFSFFVDEPSFGNLESHLAARGFSRPVGHQITARDIDNCTAMLRGQRSPEEIWNHQYGEFTWRPRWCKSFSSPSNTLRNDEQLAAGREIRSRNGQFRLVYQDDGNLVVYEMVAGREHPIWHTATHNTEPGRFVMQGDGNAVVYSRSNQPVWNSQTNVGSGYWLSLEDDGRLLIRSNSCQVWASR